MNVYIMKRVKRIVAILLVAVMVLVSVPVGPSVVEAASSYTVKFKILATSDIHGAVIGKNPETGLTNTTQGLDRVATLIKNQRNAVGTSNTILLDNGDFLFDYSSDYIYSSYNKDTQPVLKAMKRLEYDAISLGNHEFDYPDSYFKNQLKNSGLSSKIICCNLYNKDKNTLIYAPSKVITKTVKTTSNKKIKVKVGIIGATKTVLSATRQLHSDTMVTKAVVDSVKKEISSLKKQGVQLIVVSTHGGLGKANVSSKDDDVAYAISKLAGVDAIVAGHTHDIFPSENYNIKGLSGINKVTGKVNGVPLIIPGSDARGLGVIDMKLKVNSKGKVLSKTSSASFKEVTADIKADSTIKGYFSKYDIALNKERSKVISKLDSSTVLTNLDVVVKDSSIMQVINDAKMDFASEYLAKNYPSMASAKIVASTQLSSKGLNGSNDFVYAKNELTQSQLAQMLSGIQHMVLAKITGKQLKEWIEFSASIYETNYGTYSAISYYENKQSAHPLLASLDNQFAYWNNFYVFDGVTYEIDLSKNPRYNSKGSVINNSRRIVNLKYNGTLIKDTDTFVIASSYEDAAYGFMPKEGSKSTDLLYSEKQVILANNVVSKYIKKTAASNDYKLSVEADNNWRLLLPDNYTFHLYGSKKSAHASYLKNQSWYSGILYEKSTMDKTFYYGSLTTSGEAPIKDQAQICASSTTTSNKPLTLTVLGHGNSAITSVRWVKGKVTAINDTAWTSALISKTYVANVNGSYSAQITFANGTVVCKTYVVNNINPNFISTPVYSGWLTNRTEQIQGSAEPYSTVTLNDNKGHVYTAKADAKGQFKITIKYPINYLTKVTLQSSKSVGGVIRYSSKVYINTIKSGPNAATVKKVKNKATTISGTLESGAQIAVRYSGTVYVAKGMKKLYMASSGYKKGTTVKEVNVKYGKGNTYKLYLPKGIVFKKGRQLWVYAYKKIKAENKVITSKSVNIKVK